MHVNIPISPGELVDKITILEIKSARVADAGQRANVVKELGLLSSARDEALASSTQLALLTSELREINEELWTIEDELRDCERTKAFGPRFVELARSVYLRNDHRSALKRAINELLGSAIAEEKSYRPY